MTTALKLLQARENRQLRQRRLMDAYKGTLVTFTMNIPGADKNSEMITKLHKYGMSKFIFLLLKGSHYILFCERSSDAAGPIGYIAVDRGGKTVKDMAVCLEEENDFGRLFDIDVIDSDGRHVGRVDIGKAPRKCFLCNNAANICRRSGSHGPEEIMAYIGESIKGFKEYLNCI